MPNKLGLFIQIINFIKKRENSGFLVFFIPPFYQFNTLPIYIHFKNTPNLFVYWYNLLNNKCNTWVKIFIWDISECHYVKGIEFHK